MRRAATRAGGDGGAQKPKPLRAAWQLRAAALRVSTPVQLAAESGTPTSHLLSDIVVAGPDLRWVLLRNTSEKDRLANSTGQECREGIHGIRPVLLGTDHISEKSIRQAVHGVEKI
jgi:hypothetical protein